METQGILDEYVLFGHTLDVCRAQFELRNADAHANVVLIRDKYLRDAKAAIDKSDQQRFFADCAAALTELVERYKNKNFEHQRGVQTPEMRVRGRWKATSVERLAAKGRLGRRHTAAALNIAEIFEAIIGALSARARRLDGVRVDGGLPFDPVRLTDWMADKHLHVYRPWCSEILRWANGPRIMGLVQDVVCFGVSLDQARRRWRFDDQTAFRHLRDALDIFADYDEAWVPPDPDVDDGSLSSDRW